MKAVVFHKPGDMRVDEVADLKLKKTDDILLGVTRTAICGSDLHILNGPIPQTRPLVMGHEFMGIVEETGAEVTAVSKGARVVVPFPIACGKCFFSIMVYPATARIRTPKSTDRKEDLWTKKEASRR
jgi:S-(hydroxymethyl)glutathione dehydrogenase / alcohol dehydrogenase